MNNLEYDFIEIRRMDEPWLGGLDGRVKDCIDELEAPFNDRTFWFLPTDDWSRWDELHWALIEVCNEN